MRSGRASLGVSWREFGLRLVLVAVLLLALDAWAQARVPATAVPYDAAFRMPEDASLDELDPFLRHIRQTRSSHPDDVIVVFLGASPAYGIGIRDPKNTFSAAFESAAASDTAPAGRRIRAYNLAANGLLLGDQYVIAKALGDAADLYVVQLTYQTFDPRRSASKMRESDLPAMLHVGLTAEEARALGVERRTDTPLDRVVDEAVRNRWFALGHKAEIAGALALDDAPRRLYRLAAGRANVSPDDAGVENPTADVGDTGIVETDDEGEAQGAADPTTPFDELDPALQMVAISRASENSRFTLGTGNGELRMLERLASLIRSRGQRAAFFLAPMNDEVMAAYEVLDEEQYERNVKRLGTAVGDSDFGLIDYHREPFLTSVDFVDLTHTTDSGGKLTGERLWRDLRQTVESIPER